MLAVERAQYIMTALEKNKVALVADLSREMNVSEETIRKDMNKLEKEGKLYRVHGGAYLAEGYGNETPVSVREKIYQEEKALLGSKCMDYVAEKETIFLDCSTTILHFAKQLAFFEKKLTVITNSFLIAQELLKNPKIRLILLGGELNRDTESFYGYTVFEALEKYHINKAFFSSAGLSEDVGITDATQEEADIRRKVLKQSDQCFFVADSTKIGRNSTYVIGDFEHLDYLIVDQQIPKGRERLLEQLKEHKVQVIVCRRSKNNGGDKN